MKSILCLLGLHDLEEIDREYFIETSYGLHIDSTRIIYKCKKCEEYKDKVYNYTIK